MKYKKYFRKTSLKQKGVGDFFLEEVKLKSPRNFLEIGVFHGVTARNVCELLYKIHKDNFKYVGLDLFEENDVYIFAILKERWVSGLNQQFAKLSYVITRTGGSNPPLSAIKELLHFYDLYHIPL